MVEQVERGSMDVFVRNLGGIERLETAVEPGVTVLVGRNATNRTSLLQSVVAALGGSAGELRGSAEEGHVRLDVDGEVATREFERRDGAVHAGGEPYTDDADVVDLFASLLEENRARRAVERADGDELREIVMAPVDTEALQDRIASTRREIDSIERRLQEIDRQLGNLPALEQRRRQRADELDDVESELADLRAAVEDAGGAGPDASDNGPADHGQADHGQADDGPAGGGSAAGDDPGPETDELVAELQSAREELERVRDDRETQAEALASTEEELAEVESELEDLDVPEAEVDELESELDDLHRRERDLSATVSSLLSIVEFNEELVEGAAELPLGDDPADPGGSDPTAALDPERRDVQCWTCGTTVEQAAVTERLDDLRAVVEEKRAERDEVADRTDEVRNALAELREHGERREQLRERRAEVEAEVEERRERVAALQEREATLRERVAELEAETADRADDERAEQLERYERISELEYERGQLAEELDRLDDEVAATEALRDEAEQLEDQRQELSAELESLRGRVEAVETAAIDTFNDHVATVLDLLEYGNLERVWIERRTAADDASTFELHVVRADEDGTVYEDTVEHLSESEREVLGLVVALAGYLVHDVHETVPVMVLDSLEAIDADRIASLVDYVSEYAPYLLVALLPEDAQALDPEYERIRMGAE